MLIFVSFQACSVREIFAYAPSGIVPLLIATTIMRLPILEAGIFFSIIKRNIETSTFCVNIGAGSLRFKSGSALSRRLDQDPNIYF
jgi:hypothetical protein